jgi:adenosylcobinamide-GDP ribazoletransferase
MSAVTAAIRFLTIVPAPGGEWSARSASRSVAWFPAVGLGIGGAAAAINWAARLAMPDMPAAALALAAGVVLTGALHLDGLADTFDGLLGGDTPKRRLEIMKDPSIGVFGITAVVLVLMAGWAGLSSLPDVYGWAAIVVAAMAGRFAAVASMAIFRYLPSQGLGSPFRGAGRVAYLAAAVFAAALAFVLAGPFGLAALAGATVVGLAVSAFAARRLGGGVTGDVYGAAIELAEVSALLAFVALFSAGLDISPVWSG